MFKLIKNEIYKLFHKKSTYITLVILFLFVILVNVIYNNMESYNSYEYYDSDYVASIEAEISSFNQATHNKEEYASLLATYEIQKYVQDNANNWKEQVYYSNIQDQVYEYYYKLHVNNDEKGATELRYVIDEKVAKLDAGDWRYFVNLELEKINTNIEALKSMPKDTNHDLERAEYQKYLLEYRLENNISYEKSYLNNALENLKELINDKINYENAKTDEEKDNYKTGYAEFFENEYIIKNKVDTNNEQSLRGIIKNFFDEYFFLILVFVVMVSGAIVSDEFSKGTIKSLLTLPYSRIQILLSKFITTLVMILFVTLFLLIAELLVGGIIFGFGSLSVPVVGYNFELDAVESMSLFKYFLLNFVAVLPMLILLGTLAFALSTIICSTAFAITITFCSYIASALINEFAIIYKMKFLNYFVTTNWDLRSFLFGGTSAYGIPITQSIIVCLIYFAIMVVVSIVIFCYNGCSFNVCI